MAENVAKTKRMDPWKQMVSIFLAKAADGDQNFVKVVINGRLFQVPRGKRQLVPKPVYEVLSRSEHAKNITELYDAQNVSVEKRRE